jgi:hypothetical protein
MAIFKGKGVLGEHGFEILVFQGLYSSPNGELFASFPIDNNGNLIEKKKRTKSQSIFHK